MVLLGAPLPVYEWTLAGGICCWCCVVSPNGYVFVNEIATSYKGKDITQHTYPHAQDFTFFLLPLMRWPLSLWGSGIGRNITLKAEQWVVYSQHFGQLYLFPFIVCSVCSLKWLLWHRSWAAKVPINNNPKMMFLLKTKQDISTPVVVLSIFGGWFHKLRGYENNTPEHHLFTPVILCLHHL